MSLLTRLLTPAAVIVAALAVTLPTTASAASATTITACVKTKTGVARILTAKQAKKKCPKGSRKMTWSVGKNGKNGTNGKNAADGSNGTNGANGKDGLPGAQLQVHDSAGNLVGLFAKATTLIPGGLQSYPITTYTVLRADGGFYDYLPNGKLYPTSPDFSSPAFMDSRCIGTAYLGATGSDPATYWLRFFGSQGRWVYRAIDKTNPFKPPGVPRAWKFSTATATVPPAATFYQLDPLGTCTAIDPGSAPAAGDTLSVLTSIPAPPDADGALKIG